MVTHEEKKKADLLEKIKDNKCVLCGEDVFMHISMPVHHATADGKGMNVDPNVQVPVPACQYHFILLNTGLFQMVADKEKNTMGIQGPPAQTMFVVESIFNAKILMHTIAEKEQMIENSHLRALNKCRTCDGGVQHSQKPISECDGCTHLRTCIPASIKKHHAAPEEDDGELSMP